MYAETTVAGIHYHSYKKSLLIEELHKHDRRKKKQLRPIVLDYGTVFGSYRNKHPLNIGKYPPQFN